MITGGKIVVKFADGLDVKTKPVCTPLPETVADGRGMIVHGRWESCYRCSPLTVTSMSANLCSSEEVAAVKDEVCSDCLSSHS